MKRSLSAKFGALFISILFASIGAEIVFIPIVIAAIFISQFLPDRLIVNSILIIVAFILATISWILIFKKSYQYFSTILNELHRPTRKESILLVFLTIFVFLLAVILVEWAEKVAK
jgi:hypothetical protein